MYGNIIRNQIIKTAIVLIIILSGSSIYAAESFTSGPTNTPDPFNYGAGPAPAQTTVNFTISDTNDVRIEIYDKPPDTTKLIRRFYSELAPMVFSLNWDGTDDNGTELTNGTYTGKFKLKLNLSLQLTIQEME
ncbi:unnamed protein product [marine sediment metagenome]|uniref:FlgD Ig-like domain-containing protein n=1 Tax=marine sediment metagenome TaxID=412755 RepID=X1IQL1_9ZZZZ